MSKSQALGTIFLFMGALPLWLFVRQQHMVRALPKTGVRRRGTVLESKLRNVGEGRAWQSRIRYPDGDGVVRERWFSGQHEGELALLVNPQKWKWAMIVADAPVARRVVWKARLARLFIITFTVGLIVPGLLLASGIWEPRIGDPDMASVCAGTPSERHPAYTPPSPVVIVEASTGQSIVGSQFPETPRVATVSAWDAQLVVCLGHVEERSVATCVVDGDLVEFFDVDYDVVLRETRTAHVVGHATATAQWPDPIKDGCGARIEVDGVEIPVRSPFQEAPAVTTHRPKPAYSTDLPTLADFLTPYTTASNG